MLLILHTLLKPNKKSYGGAMKKPTLEEVKETLVKYNDGNDRFGTVFDAACKTIAHYISDDPKKPKKT